jgi:hypothetical protein
MSSAPLLVLGLLLLRCLGPGLCIRTSLDAIILAVFAGCNRVFLFLDIAGVKFCEFNTWRYRPDAAVFAIIIVVGKNGEAIGKQ